jgi:hypothetical protein
MSPIGHLVGSAAAMEFWPTTPAKTADIEQALVLIAIGTEAPHYNPSQ